MNNISNEIYMLMDRWAEVASMREDKGVGYGESSLGRFGMPALMSFASRIPSGVSDVWEAVALIDYALARMNELVSAAVREKYLGKGIDEQKAQRLGISRATLHRRVHDGLVLVQEAWQLGEVDFDFRVKKMVA